MEDYDRGDLIVQFTWCGRNVTIRASGKGYAALWLKRHPRSTRTRATKPEYEQRALAIGKIAVYSVLRDWIKGQITAVKTGILSFEAAFLGQILLANGETVMERIERDQLLALAPPPAPDAPAAPATH
jgi:hypothetical protein